MSNTAAALSNYQQALKAGRRAHRQSVHSGNYPYLQVLDEILTDNMTAEETYLGLINIPTEKIVGTKTHGRHHAFASNFMPLLSEDSEFGIKWRRLCEAHLSDEGIREPIECYEYLGRFYVLEGNKRVSVLKHFGASSIPGIVTRIMPADSDAEEVKLYKEFLQYYPLTKQYRINFSRRGSFPKLQIAMGYDVDHEWTEKERRRFSSGFFYFVNAFQKLGGDELKATAADALLIWLKVYSFDMLREMSAGELQKSLQAVWSDVKALDMPSSIEMSTEEEPQSGDKGIFGKIVSSLISGPLKIAFVHELTLEGSNWVRNHERGREKLEESFGRQISTVSVFGVGKGAEAEAAMEKAIEEGAELIFTTTAPLINACRKIAARHPGVRILNCSVSMPYTGVRTYYSRIYEGKFISGAIAGALSDNNNIGYIASYPIFGVPAGINAFALGAQMTNPRARVQLKWSCVPGDPLAELRERGVDFVSTLDIPMPGWEDGLWGSFQLFPDGSTKLIASPYWDWGEFYIRIVRRILSGDWDGGSGKHPGRAVNYWWGMASGVIGVEYTKALPEGVETLVSMLKKNIIDRSLSPFDRRIVSQDGTVISDGSHHFSPEEILHMDWLCDNVDGSIPDFESLKEQSRAIVRLQGVYRESIPPEKEGVIL